MNVTTWRRWSEMALVVGAPLGLAVVELLHPVPRDILGVDLKPWFVVHYAQIALFPLSALAVAWLVRGQAGFAAAVCRVAMFIFGVGWAAWDTVAGVSTGVLLRAARASGTPETWRPAIEAVWTDPIMGGFPAPVFPVLGAISLSVGAVAAAVALRRLGISWGPVLLLAISSFGVTIFRTHAWPGGPLTFGGLAVAGAWVLSERARNAARASR